MYLSERAVRQKENFNRNWHFHHEDDGVSGDPVLNGKPEVGAFDIADYRAVKLPHDWSLEYPFEEDAASCGSGGYVKTGIGWYRKLFCVSPDAVAEGRVMLRFDGAYMLASVWVNGQYLGRHVYGYTPFEWDITDTLKRDGSENVVDVKVDNSAQPSSRWYSGSGITRDVWIYKVKDVHVIPYGVYVRQPSVTGEEARLTVETSIHAPEGTESITVKTRIEDPRGNVCASGEKNADRSASKTQLAVCQQDFTVVNPSLWSVETPDLYQVVTTVYADGNLTDEVYTTTGLRSAEFDSEKGFLLNGERVKLNGFCIHHDGGCLGAAVPLPIWERRLEKMKDMGANAVRMSHNPPNPGLLDLCDKMGFLVMDEAFDEWRILKQKEFGSNTHESRGYSEWFGECFEEDLTCMIRRDRNHPSIVIWSIGNEVPDQMDPEGHLTARHLKQICKSLDPDRAVTQANDQICAEPKPAREEFLEELDVVGYNYVDRWRTRAETMYDDDKRAHPHWCMIGTENGGMGGVRGEYRLTPSENAGWWKFPYFSAPVLVGKVLKFTMTHDYVAGDFMWTGIDYLGEAHWPERIAGSGVLDTCGFEKDSFYFYRSVWNTSKPTVHLLPHWNLDVEEGSVIQVLGYTGCDSAELFVNGKSYGRKASNYPAYGMTERYGHFDRAPQPVNTDDLFLSWDVPYVPGCIELVGYQDGKEAARHTVHTAGTPAKIRVHSYRDKAKADGLDIGQIEVEIVDRSGNFCPQADAELTFTVCGPASLIGVDGGNPGSMENVKGNRIRAFHGRAFAVIQSDGQRGNCVVKVAGANLEDDSISICFE